MQNLASCLKHLLRKGMVVTSALGLIMWCSSAPAQSGVGSIQGTVTDSTGAALPGAAVHVVNVATGVATDARSNGTGFYQVPDLFSGSYRVTVNAPGMKAYTTSIELMVAQSAVINPVLSPGSVTQQVVVSGDTMQLTTTDSSAISSTLENVRLDTIPNNGRLTIQYVQDTTPGVENQGKQANGLQNEGMSYRIDGVTTMQLDFGSEAKPRVGAIDSDSIQEMAIQTSTGAQYSEPTTAIVTTKSGTNSFHGTAFETARNNSLGIAKARSDPSNLVAPHYVENEFGASMGGPIILPHVYHGKNKSFWFFAYERYSLAQAKSAEYAVPSTAMRQGDFSGAVNSSGILQTIYDPSTTQSSSNCAATGKANAYCRTPFPNNTIPIGEISPAAKTLFALMPQPTSAANPLVTTNLTQPSPWYQFVPQETFRLDHEFNENNRAYMRYSDVDSPVQNTSSTAISAAADGIPSGAAEGYVNIPLQAFYTGVGYTHIFSPLFFAETILTQQWVNISHLNGVAPTVNYEATLGLPNNFGEPGFPKTTGLIDNLVSSQTSTFDSQIISDLVENLTKTVGRHELHFGGRFDHARVADQPAGSADTLAFATLPTAVYNPTSGGNYTAVTNTGSADASFFLGSASSYTVSLPAIHSHYHTNELDAYIQDDYHVSKGLVLNLGVRYEALPAAWTKDGLMNSFDFKNDAMVLAVPPSQLISEGYTTQAIITNDENIGVKFETPAQAGMPANTLRRNYDLNLLPRAGFAYQPFGGKYGTVLRGGYGRFIFPATLANFLTAPQLNNPYVGSYSQSYTSAAQAVDGLPNELLRYNTPATFGVMGTNTTNVVNTNTSNSIVPGVAITATSPDYAPYFATETSFTIEQPLKGNSVLRASWIWTHGTNLDYRLNFNNAPSTLQWEMATGTLPPNGGASVIGTPQQNTYAATATLPYDQTTWGSGSTLQMKSAWSNYNALQVNYQRIFHSGIAYQVYYVFAKTLRAGGDSVSGPQGVQVTEDPYANYPGAEGAVATMTSPYGTIGPVLSPPRPPAGVPLWASYHALNKFEMYGQDPTIPYHHIQFNGVVDLPIGRNQRFFGNVNRFVNELIGGYQIVGNGSVVSQAFAAPTSYHGPVSPLQVYKHQHPITDCSSGTCYKEYLWFNGYLSPKVTQGVTGSVCTTNCITGLPASYQPLQAPIDNTPGTTYFGSDEVQITAPNINSGKATDIVYDAGPIATNVYGHTFIDGPFNFEADASIFKTFPIKESVRLRIDMDAFNVFNVQGFNNPGANGVEKVQPGVGQATSYNSPRQIAITARLTF